MEIYYDKQVTIKTKTGLVLVNPQDLALEKNKELVKLALYTVGDFGNGDIGARVMVVRGPGEYDVAGIHLAGWRVGVDETIYLVEIEEVKMALIPQMTDKWDKKKQERLGEADVVVVWGGKVGAKKSQELIKNLGVNHLIVISETEESRKEFMDEFDLSEGAQVDSVKIDKQNLSESLEVLIINDH